MRKFQSKHLIAISAISFLILLLVISGSFTKGASLSLYSILSFPTKVASVIFQTGYELLHFKSIAKENLKLKRDITALSSRAAAMDEAVAENKRLKELLSLKDRISKRAVAAKVTGRDFSNWGESIVIGKGSRNGMKTGMAVIADGVVIGKVTAVGIGSSRVSLITDPEIRVSVVSQRGRAGGLMYGIAHGRCIIKFIARDADIKTGDTVVTSGLSDVYPSGFLVGKVIDVKMELNGMYRFAVIEPAFNAMAVEEVLAVE